MSGEVAISLLFFAASLQPVTAGGWRSLGGSYSPFAGLRLGFLLCRCLGSISPGLGGRPGWAPGRTDGQAQGGGLGKGAAGGMT